MALTKYSICSPPEVIKAIDAIAKARKRSRSFIMTEAAEKYLANGGIASKAESITHTKKAGAR